MRTTRSAWWRAAARMVSSTGFVPWASTRDIPQAFAPNTLLTVIGVRRHLLSWRRTPSSATIGRVLQAVDGDALDRAVGAYLADRHRAATEPAVAPPESGRRRVIAVDGKALKGSARLTSVRRHLLSAVTHGCVVTLAQAEVGAKTNETTHFRPLLAPLDLAGAVVTFAADRGADGAADRPGRLGHRPGGRPRPTFGRPSGRTRHCGALGKQANCQVAVSVHAVTDAASCPLDWRLFVPEEWAEDDDRRTKTGVPVGVGHREKWRLALDEIDELAGWGLAPPMVAADAGYGQNAEFRAGLDRRGLGYVVAVRSDVTVHPGDAEPVTPPWSGNGRRPQARYRQAPQRVAALALEAGPKAFAEVTWREGSRGPMRSRFLALRVRPAGVRARRLVQQAAAAREGSWDGVLPAVWLLAEWPESQEAPTDYWLSNLPEGTPTAELVRLAKIRWRIEHDYREMKHGLGLDHFEGRSWTGWHHHVTLVTAAHAFLTQHRLHPKARTPA